MEYAGILHSYGDTSKELRSRTITKLRKYGYGKSNFNELLQREAMACLDILEKERVANPGSIICIKEDTFVLPMVNILWTFLTGTNFPNPIQLKSIITSIENSFNNHVKRFAILFAYKFLRFIPGLTVFQTTFSVWRECETIIKVKNQDTDPSLISNRIYTYDMRTYIYLKSNLELRQIIIIKI